MGIFDSFFIKEEEQANQSVPPVSIRPQAIVPQDNSQKEKSQKYLTDLMASRNLPGPDYYEFNQFVESMTNLPHNTAVESAIQMMKIQNVTPAKLAESANYYIKEIENNSLEFRKSVKEEAEKIENKYKNVSEWSTKKAQMEKQIQDLQQQIINGDELCLKESELREAELSKLQTALQSHEVVADELITKIKTDISIINGTK